MPLEDVSASLLSLELLDFALLLDDSFIEEDCSLLLEDPVQQLPMTMTPFPKWAQQDCC